MMKKYTSIVDLNNDQRKAINENGWTVFTECNEGSSYYNKGYSWVNRIGYIILSGDVEVDYIDSYDELNKLASYDDDFDELVREILEPIEDKCYVFLVKEPAHYHFEQMWTNKGLEDAKKMARHKIGFQHEYYDQKDYDKMKKEITRHNNKVKRDTEKAIELLKANGFKIVSRNFAVLK